MSLLLSPTITHQYGACGHASTVTGEAAAKAVERLGDPNPTNVVASLDGVGHWTPTADVANQVPRLQMKLPEIGAAVASGQLSLQAGSYVALDARLSTQLALDGGVVPNDGFVQRLNRVAEKSLEDIGRRRDVVQAELFRYFGEHVGNLAFALRYIDTKTDDKNNTHARKCAGEWYQKLEGPLHENGPSKLRYLFVLGASYKRAIPWTVTLYDKMLRYGDPNEVALGLFSVEGMTDVLRSKDHAGSKNHQVFKGKSDLIKDALRLLLEGRNPLCNGARLEAVAHPQSCGDGKDPRTKKSFADRAQLLIGIL